ncbi:hypothetical protein V5P93_005665 [Actinokineospora auranticolor]|uniref:Thioredoxin-like protein n=1 Tax=Actinokineospora auranticolor TaxID=155976 RepID=A0A2S6GEZ1_9PSEU|nr:hypothetical protein [Actinokineospora auranticolor]PPK63793.1 hypothetical protein CLV40_12437 [Actinokineospora auranticolor]
MTGPESDRLVETGAFAQQITRNLTAAENDPALRRTDQQGSRFGTPTVVVNGKVVDWQQPGWLDSAFAKT